MNTAAMQPAPAASVEHSEGVWHAAWRRFKTDRVGLVCAVIVMAFLLLIALASLGLVAKGWQKEVGVSSAPPTRSRIDSLIASLVNRSVMTFKMIMKTISTIDIMP